MAVPTFRCCGAPDAPPPLLLPGDGAAGGVGIDTRVCRCRLAATRSWRSSLERSSSLERAARPLRVADSIACEYWLGVFIFASGLPTLVSASHPLENMLLFNGYWLSEFEMANTAVYCWAHTRVAWMRP